MTRGCLSLRHSVLVTSANIAINHTGIYCLDSLHYIFVRDSMGYLQPLWCNWSPKATEFSEMTQYINGHYGVQGRSRSSISVPTESPYATSYLWIIVTFFLYCTVSEIWRITGQIFALDSGGGGVSSPTVEYPGKKVARILFTVSHPHIFPCSAQMFEADKPIYSYKYSEKNFDNSYYAHVIVHGDS